jgi:hypothetical protein
VLANLERKKHRSERKQVEENIRLEALNALATLAIHDPVFQSRAFDDLEGTLARYGFTLNDRELQEVRDFQDRIRGSDEELVQVFRNPRTIYARWRHH